jgi:hypothetical protein
VQVVALRKFYVRCRLLPGLSGAQDVQGAFDGSAAAVGIWPGSGLLHATAGPAAALAGALLDSSACLGTQRARLPEGQPATTSQPNLLQAAGGSRGAASSQDLSGLEGEVQPLRAKRRRMVHGGPALLGGAA